MAPRQKLSYVDDAVSVGRRLRAAREQAGISQRALSFPGCTAAYISRIENGERIPSLQLLREFATRLNVGEQYLAYGRDELPVPRTTPTEARVAIRMGDFETARELATAGLDGAQSDGERAAAFSLLGEVALAEGEIDASRAALERASALDPTIEERDPRAAESLGRMYARAFEYESAAAVFARNRDRAVAASDPINEVRFASLLANAQIDAGNFGAAEESLAGAIRASETVADPLTVARMFWSQSRLHSHQQDTANAARYAQRALELLEASDQYYDIARCHQLLAHVELERGNNELAAELLDRAAPTIAASGRKFELASFRIEQARVLLKANRREEAGAIAMQASAEMAGQSPVDSGRSYALLASVFAELDDEERAIELYELAIESLNATPNRWLVDAYSKLAELHEKRGDQEAMIEALKRGMSVQRQADRLLAER
jgi:tetratricopeptide (TPR) repeat protein